MRHHRPSGRAGSARADCAHYSCAAGSHEPRLPPGTLRRVFVTYSFHERARPAAAGLPAPRPAGPALSRPEGHSLHAMTPPTHETQDALGLIHAFWDAEGFQPREPRNLEEAGLTE